jgi:phenylpyruvate tautomerase PptA (4-oxalocrotonate tautomerase family)
VDCVVIDQLPDFFRGTLQATAQPSGHIHPITKGMPIYQCSSPKRLLTKSARAKIASEITRIHCEVTGERPSLVNVQFPDVLEGTSFNAGRPPTRSFVMGEIRHGHDVQTRHTLLRDSSQTWIRLTSQSEAELIVGPNGNPC